MDTDDPILGDKANQIAIMEHILGRKKTEEVETFLHDESINLIDCNETKR